MKQWILADTFTRAGIFTLLLLPLLELFLPGHLQFSDTFRSIFVYSILALGLNLITGSTGLLNLGAAAFMAIGAYTYAILTCSIYPFQAGFWIGTAVAVAMGGLAGMLLGLPVLRLRGDYLAIVTLGFGEIMQDVLRNLESITKGTQGINPLPPPSVGSYALSSDRIYAWYYGLLAVLFILLLLYDNLEHSRFGRRMLALREDELALRCMGTGVIRVKLFAFTLGSAISALAGALWVSFLGSSGDPGNYDFQLSIIALSIVIVGGLGSIRGIIPGAILMLGINGLVLSKLSSFIGNLSGSGSSNVLLSPSNWKYFIFGLVLILMMRFRPQGLIPAKVEGRNGS